MIQDSMCMYVGVLLCGVLLLHSAYGQEVQPISCSLPSQCLDIGIIDLSCNYDSRHLFQLRVSINGKVQFNLTISSDSDHHSVYSVPILEEYDGLEIAVSYGTSSNGRWTTTLCIAPHDIDVTSTFPPQPVTSGSDSIGTTTTSTPYPSSISTVGPVVDPNPLYVYFLIGILVAVVVILVIILFACVAYLECRRRRQRQGANLADEHSRGGGGGGDGGGDDDDPAVPRNDVPLVDVSRTEAKPPNPPPNNGDSDGGFSKGVVMSNAMSNDDDVSYSIQEECSSFDSSCISLGSCDFRSFQSLFRGQSEHTCLSEKDMLRLSKLGHSTSKASQVSQFLERHEAEFFDKVDAKVNLLKLKRKKVITEGVSSEIESSCSENAKEILFDHLKNNVDVVTLSEFCKVALAIDAYPKMRQLGDKLLSGLPLEDCDPRFLDSLPPDQAPTRKWNFPSSRKLRTSPPEEQLDLRFPVPVQSPDDSPTPEGELPSSWKPKTSAPKELDHDSDSEDDGPPDGPGGTGGRVSMDVRPAVKRVPCPQRPSSPLLEDSRWEQDCKREDSPWWLKVPRSDGPGVNMTYHVLGKMDSCKDSMAAAEVSDYSTCTRPGQASNEDSSSELVMSNSLQHSEQERSMRPSCEVE